MEPEKIFLEHCPFCGGEAQIVSTTEVIGHGACVTEHYVQCLKCKAKGPMESEYYEEKEACIKACKAGWNRRADNEATM